MTNINSNFHIQKQGLASCSPILIKVTFHHIFFLFLDHESSLVSTTVAFVGLSWYPETGPCILYAHTELTFWHIFFLFIDHESAIISTPISCISLARHPETGSCILYAHSECTFQHIFFLLIMSHHYCEVSFCS